MLLESGYINWLCLVTEIFKLNLSHFEFLLNWVDRVLSSRTWASFLLSRVELELELVCIVVEPDSISLMFDSTRFVCTLTRYHPRLFNSCFLIQLPLNRWWYKKHLQTCTYKDPSSAAILKWKHQTVGHKPVLHANLYLYELQKRFLAETLSMTSKFLILFFLDFYIYFNT